MNEILLRLPAPIACHSERDQLLRTLLRHSLMLQTWIRIQCCKFP